jgi:hypothetical protein
MAAGRALRDKTPRLAHGHWRAPDGRHDPIAILRASDEGRVQHLVPIRYGRMLASPFAFYRGSAAIMAADLATTPASGLRVQVCGDCHLMNFGGFATPERNILFDINDFDETLPGPWEWDLKRLTASFVLAARSLGLSDDKGRETAAECARSYRKHVQDYARMHPLDVWYARVTDEDALASVPARDRSRLRARIDKALKQSGSEVDFPKLTDMVGGKLAIRDAPPLIFHPEATREPDFGLRVDRLLADYRKTLPEDRRSLLDAYHPVDAAMKVVGVGSVGTRCWIALLMSASNEPLFLQGKQAVASVLEPFAGPSVRHVPGLGHRRGWRALLPAPIARREDQARDRDVRSQPAHGLRQDVRLGAGTRPFQGGRRRGDRGLHRLQRPARPGSGRLQHRLRQPGGKGSRRPEGGRAQGRHHRLRGSLRPPNVLLNLPSGHRAFPMRFR